jgi:hypothetical protein
VTDCGPAITLPTLYYVHLALPSSFLYLETVVFFEILLQWDCVPFSGTRNSRPRMMRQSHLHVDQYVFAAIICALTQQLQLCGRARRIVRFVRLALKVFVQNNGDFIDKILLYLSTRENGISFQQNVISLQFFVSDDGFPDTCFEFQDFEEYLLKSGVRKKFEPQSQRGKEIVSEIQKIIDSTYNQAEKLKTQKAEAKKKLECIKQQLSLFPQEMNGKNQKMVEDVKKMVSCFRGTSVSCIKGMQ